MGSINFGDEETKPSLVFLQSKKRMRDQMAPQKIDFGSTNRLKPSLVISKVTNSENNIK